MKTIKLETLGTIYYDGPKELIKKASELNVNLRGIKKIGYCLTYGGKTTMLFFEKSEKPRRDLREIKEILLEKLMKDTNGEELLERDFRNLSKKYFEEISILEGEILG